MGGARNERRKWVHAFEGLSCMIFVVALSDYDMMVREAVGVNRMAESIQVFDDLCNSGWFTDCSLVLFFNKEDVFREKIERVNLNVCFKDYSGKMEYNECMELSSTISGENQQEQEGARVCRMCNQRRING
jgi:G-protein alpha subunit